MTKRKASAAAITIGMAEKVTDYDGSEGGVPTVSEDDSEDENLKLYTGTIGTRA